MAGVAAFERARIRERQREGIEAAKKAGKYTGSVIRFDPTRARELAGDRPAPGLRSQDGAARAPGTEYLEQESA